MTMARESDDPGPLLAPPGKRHLNGNSDIEGSIILVATDSAQLQMIDFPRDKVFKGRKFQFGQILGVFTESRLITLQKLRPPKRQNLATFTGGLHKNTASLFVRWLQLPPKNHPFFPTTHMM